MRPSAGTGTISKLAVVRPCWKLRVESTGRSPSGQACSQPAPAGWLATTLTATAETLAGAGMPLAPVALKVVVPRRQGHVVDHGGRGHGDEPGPLTVEAALAYQPRRRTITLVAAVEKIVICPDEETGTVSKSAVVWPWA